MISGDTESEWDGSPLWNVIPAPADDTPEPAPPWLAVALGQLCPRHRQVVALRFGLGGEKPRTLRAIGDGYGISREAVRQAEEKVLRLTRQFALA